VSSDSIVQTNDLWRDAHWFAIQAKPRRENFGAVNLSALGIEILLPRIKFERFLRGTARHGTKPLFPGYFFARFCPRDSFESVKAVRGVLQVLSSGRVPIPVDDRVIRDIRSRVQEDGLIRIHRLALTPGTRVTIHNGAFAGMMGEVERELDDRKRVAILLEALFHARLINERRWNDAEAA
jgi:transcription antitermination factor NusG